MPRPKPPPSLAHPAVTAYIDGFPPLVRERLATLRATIVACAPEAEERLAYGLPSWWQGENLIHIGGFKRHIGIYPGPEAIEAFAEELRGCVTSKGAIQVPHDAPLPLELVERLVRHRLAAVAHAGAAAAKKKPARAKPGAA
jgi:uncharacterized protein YdhG (YjbR/CyaY superfamily)